MQEKLNNLLLDDLGFLAKKLNIANAHQVKKIQLVHQIEAKLSQKSDSQQYEILKELFSIGKFEMAFYKVGSLFQSDINRCEFIYPNNKESLFLQPIRYYFTLEGITYAICIKKHLNGSNLNLNQAKRFIEQDINSNALNICITPQVVKKFFEIFFDNELLKRNFSLSPYGSLAVLYSSHSTNDAFLSTNCKLSSNNEKISKFNDKINNKTIDELEIYELIKDKKNDKKELLEHFVIKFPKNLIHTLKDIGINLCFKDGEKFVRYNFTMKNNGIIFVRNFNTDLQDIAQITQLLIGILNELRK